MQKYLNLDALTPTVLNDMGKAAYAHALNESKGYQKQQIGISYDLVGILPASLPNGLKKRRKGIAKAALFSETFLILLDWCCPKKLPLFGE